MSSAELSKYELKQSMVSSCVLHCILCEFQLGILFIERQEKSSKYLVLRPRERKKLSVIESHTTDTF